MTENMAEMNTAITDFFLSALCLFLAWKMWSAPAERKFLKDQFAKLFLATAFAAFIGGIRHADYFPGMKIPFIVLTHIAIAAASAHLWMIFGELALTEQLKKRLKQVVRILFVGFVIVAIWGTKSFALAVIAYAPAALALFLVIIRRMFATKNQYYYLGFAGFMIVFIATYLHANRIGFHSIMFDHNSVYHVLQGVAFWFIYLFGSRVSRWNM